MDFETAWECYLELARGDAHWPDAVEMLREELGDPGRLTEADARRLASAIEQLKDAPMDLAQTAHAILMEYEQFAQRHYAHARDRLS